MDLLTRRTQILLDDERYERLRREADDRGTSIGALIREAIDGHLGSAEERRREAGRQLLDADPAPAADWAELEDEIERSYERSREPPAGV